MENTLKDLVRLGFSVSGYVASVRIKGDGYYDTAIELQYRNEKDTRLKNMEETIWDDGFVITLGSCSWANTSKVCMKNMQDIKDLIRLLKQ